MKKVLVILAASAAIFVSGATASPSGCWGTCVTAKQKQIAQVAIKKVFGRNAYTALRVSHCESGHSIRAYNGSHLGLFQMGSWERSRFGHGPGAWAQTRAAYRYFKVSGWGPWSASRFCWG